MRPGKWVQEPIRSVRYNALNDELREQLNVDQVQNVRFCTMRVSTTDCTNPESKSNAATDGVS